MQKLNQRDLVAGGIRKIKMRVREVDFKAEL
jgi:hypothetical protein